MTPKNVLCALRSSTWRTVDLWWPVASTIYVRNVSKLYAKFSKETIQVKPKFDVRNVVKPILQRATNWIEPWITFWRSQQRRRGGPSNPKLTTKATLYLFTREIYTWWLKLKIAKKKRSSLSRNLWPISSLSKLSISSLSKLSISSRNKWSVSSLSKLSIFSRLRQNAS